MDSVLSSYNIIGNLVPTLTIPLIWNNIPYNILKSKHINVNDSSTFCNNGNENVSFFRDPISIKFKSKTYLYERLLSLLFISCAKMLINVICCLKLYVF